MARSCTICMHADRVTIDAALQSGQSIRDIAGQYGFAKSAVARHKTSHMQQSAPPPQQKQSGRKRPTPPSENARVAQSPPQPTTRPQGVRLPDAIRDETQRLFLDEFQAYGIVSRACAYAGIERSTVRYWEEHDEVFGFAYAQAKEIVNDMYRDEARRRAVEGVPSYVVNRGEIVQVEDESGKRVPLVEQKYSDTLLMFVMKARMPEYRDKQSLDVTTNGKDMPGFTLITAGTAAADDPRYVQRGTRMIADDTPADE